MMLERTGDTYHWGDLALIPDPPEHVLVELYLQWKQTGVLDRAFYGEPTPLLWFLQWFSRKEQSNLGVYQKDNQDRFHTLGLVWINDTFTLPGKFKRAEVAMAFCRHVKPDILMRCAQMAIEWGYEHRGLDALIGTTPVANRAAVSFGRRLGFTVAGPVHGMCTWHGNMSSVMIQSMTKDMWAEISPFREVEG